MCACRTCDYCRLHWTSSVPWCGEVLVCLLVLSGALGFAEVWEDGPVLRELAARQAALQRSREDVEAARKVSSTTGL